MSGNNVNDNGMRSKALANIKYIWKNITLEPVAFLFSLNFGFIAVAGSQLYVDKMCQVNLNYTVEICDNVNVNPDYKDIMIENQKKVVVLQTISKVIQTIPSFLYTLVAGGICDRYGRKPLIVIAIMGYTISTSVYLISIIWWYELRAEFLLLECLQDWTGGSLLFYLGVYSMVADITKKTSAESSTIRLAFMDGVGHLGFFVGNGLAGPIKANLGLKYNFAFGLLFTVISAAYVIIFIPETLERVPEEESTNISDEDQNDENRRDNSSKIGTLLSKAFDWFKKIVDVLLEGFRTVLKKRKYNDRRCLILLIIAFLLEMFTNYQWGNFFMYFRLKLQFQMQDFSTLMGITGVIGLTGQYVFVPLFTKVLRFHDASISLLDAATATIKNIFIANVSSQWILYFAMGIGFLDSTTTTVMRSMIISIVPNTEIAKVFCVVELFKAILQLIGPLIYGNLYRYTLEFFPESFLYLGIAVKVLVFIAGVLIYIELTKRQKMKLCSEYAHKKNDTSNEQENTNSKNLNQTEENAGYGTFQVHD